MNDRHAHEMEMMWLAMDDAAARAARVAMRRNAPRPVALVSAIVSRNPWSAAMRAHDSR